MKDRLIDVLKNRYLKLQQSIYVVMDEADRMIQILLQKIISSNIVAYSNNECLARTHLRYRLASVYVESIDYMYRIDGIGLTGKTIIFLTRS
ncbi:unnamed protein product [Rotaria sp. Silwood1]|nr:unnamed protein product [Rotaria sp. Silwood1]CAF1621506.1 unnamed protein product [Rotaria sp. Silwood1]CAF3755048.1 unnamed protein product [Rotaria sp. Silwood1]CAF4732498.1 unnamed protein product [Rotaria sp. Silwood1]